LGQLRKKYKAKYYKITKEKNKEDIQEKGVQKRARAFVASLKLSALDFITCLQEIKNTYSS
jgi:hypothetical protein